MIKATLIIADESVSVSYTSADSVTLSVTQGASLWEADGETHVKPKGGKLVNAEYLELGGKVDKVAGKGLSTNDYTDEDAAKLVTLENYDDTAVLASLDNKVDKVSGKGLSTNDFTDALETKLNGIEESANNYTHPANHDPSIITQDASNRFVTDTEKSTWNSKADTLHTHTSASVTFSPAGTISATSVQGAIEELDTEKLSQANIDASRKKTSSNPLFYGKKNKMVGHAGVLGLEPENTIPSFERAGKEGFWGCEADIKLTSDGEFVCMHDNTVDRTTNGTGNVVDLTLAQIKALTVDAGSNIVSYTGLTVPTLNEYLEVCLRYNMVPFMHANVDVAHIPDLVAEVKEFGLEYNAVFSMDNATQMAEVEKYCNSPVIGVWYTGGNMSTFPTTSGFKNGGHADITLLTTYPNIITTWHDNGATLGFWNINTVADVLSAFENGADWVETETITPTQVFNNQMPYINKLGLQEKTPYGVITGLVTAQQTVADMTVKVSAGTIYMANGDRFTPSATASLAVTTADATNPRIDSIYVNKSGIVSYLAGTPASTPSQPTTPSGGQVIATILVTAGKTSILTADITQKQKPLWTEAPIYPTLKNSWVANDAARAFYYYKDVFDVVHLGGMIKGGTVPSQFVQLPSGYRPTQTIWFPVVSNGAFGAIYIANDGNITVQVGNTAYVALWGITYKAGMA